MADAEDLWLGLCSGAGCDRSSAAGVWALIAVAYAEPHRHYHTLDHIRALLALRAAHAAAFAEPDVADLAILLHDIVYDPMRQDNEAASAAWARAHLAQLGFSAATVETVSYFIELSRHDADGAAGIDPSSDLALFLDLDLSVLAAEPPVYREYALAIRREYAVYPDVLYRPGRARVLDRFLERSAIYQSERLRADWEQRARLNIETELRGLSIG